MQAIRQNKRNNRWVIVALIAATAIVGWVAAQNLSGLFDAPNGAPTQQEAEAPASPAVIPFVPSLVNGPVPGMPRSTYQALTGTDTVFTPSLTDGPVPGMPRSTYEALTTSEGGSVGRPAGMPDYVWEDLSR